ncbi:MAG: ferrous iron transport protein B [Oscillospiraceae bacterium]|jgi:ferrous iron transport protein B|nr:ferrous iron transport protein B [Oscillospiraceae bacterium]
MIKIALAGNPNSGKTSMFNALTGSNQYIGNWPGVTVEKKEGKLKIDPSVRLVDLPGIYSLSPYTAEEVVARNFLVNEKPDCIINILDGTNLERNLYLTTQLLELNIPMVVAVNMMDVVEKKGDTINLQILASRLKCPVFAVSALQKKGLKEAAKKAIELVRFKKQPAGFECFEQKLTKYLLKIEAMLPKETDYSKRRFAAVKLFERDEKIGDIIANPPDVSSIITAAEAEFGEDAESIVTNARYELITELTAKILTKNAVQKKSISDKIDSVLTNRFLALPIFALIIFLVYYISVSTLGTIMTDWMNDSVFGEGFDFFGVFVPSIPDAAAGFLQSINTAAWLNSLIIDGMIAGVGAVLGFVPQMFLLFLILAFLEYCGYMSRIAFVLDGIFRRFGLSGKSFIPMLLGTGCSVPGIMAARTIESESDKKITIITTSFIPCSAKQPVIALIASVLFGGAWWVAPASYFIGAAAVVLSGAVLKKLNMFKKEYSPFVMELPAYHLPKVSNILRSAWDRAWSFIKKAGTIILISSIVVWFLCGFGINGSGLYYTQNLDESILAAIGNGLAWVFVPLGFGDWRSTVATLLGVVAKENVVSTFSILSTNGEEGAVAELFNSLSGFSFLLFNLLCFPCVAAIATIFKEMHNLKWSLFALFYQTGLAYAVAMCVFQIGLLAQGVFSGFTVAAFVLILAALYFLVIKKDKRLGT